MLTAEEGVVSQIDLPSGFVLKEQLKGGMGQNWLRKYASQSDPGVVISLFYRGAPELADYAKEFRRALKSKSVIFDLENGPNDDDSKARVRAMQSCLGNAGNNQISNENKGLTGPRFFLEKIQTFALSGRSVMSVQGYFFGPDGEPDNNFLGIFIDADPENPRYCKIEEIIFESETWEAFEKYFPQFQASLNSIRWA